MSDLPTLLAMYKPDMKLQSIVALINQEDNNQLTGLQVNLENDRKQYLELPIVGAKPDEWASQKEHFRSNQPDKISILTNEDFGGVCDVVLYQGEKVTHLSHNNWKCHAELDGVKETMLRLPEETPLVGFHGTADE